jgi:hypothetical protein
MTKQFVAEFGPAERLVNAARQLDRDGHLLLDAFTPFPVAELDELLAVKSSNIRLVMLLGGLAMAAFAYWLQWYSSVVDYPLNLGGRPLHSWPVFLLVPFEVGILAAVICGFIALLWNCGLPRLHHPVFDIVSFERASQDRFFLFAATRDAQEQAASLRQSLERTGALSVSEVWSA